MSVILNPCLFPVINSQTGDELRENLNPQFFSKNSGFCNSKSLNFYYIVIPIFSKPFIGRIVKYPVDEEVL